MKKCFCLALVLCIGLSTLCACDVKKNKYTTTTMEYFDTVITITGYEKSKDAFDTTAGEIIAQFKEYHQLYSIYDELEGINNIHTINKIVNGEHQTVLVDRRIIDLLIYAKDMHEKTGGMMNIAMGSVLSLWHQYRENGNKSPDTATLPPIDALKEASKHTDIAKMVIDKENNTVTLLDPEMTLDVGAIAKGYAARCVANALKDKGVMGYLLNVGGSVCTIGNRGDGKKWSVGIENPQKENYLSYLELNGQSVVTSGSYQRFYKVNGKKYHHIIDPNTLMPSDKYLSVSVICDDPALGDALSTALFCMLLEEGKNLINSLPNTEALWITVDGKKISSAGWHQNEKYYK